MDGATHPPVADALPDATAFASIYAELLELAEEHLTRPVSTTIDTWEDGTFRIRVYHHIPPESQETLYYHSAEGEVRYGIETPDELKDERVVTTIEAAGASE